MPACLSLIGGDNNAFGDFFKAKRIELKLTLRKFADNYEEDPAYISRLERGLVAAPKAKEKLKFYAEALGLAEGSPDWDQFLSWLPYLTRLMESTKFKMKNYWKSCQCFCEP
ncbi:MAG: helix-turn-helix transcriptional regulator [Bdellovibrionales bacterium]